MDKVCSKCGKKIPAQAKFCSECGAKLVSTPNKKDNTVAVAAGVAGVAVAASEFDNFFGFQGSGAVDENISQVAEGVVEVANNFDNFFGFDSSGAADVADSAGELVEGAVDAALDTGADVAADAVTEGFFGLFF